MRIKHLSLILLLGGYLVQQPPRAEQNLQNASNSDSTISILTYSDDTTPSDKQTDTVDDVQGLRNDILNLRQNWQDAFNKNTATTNRSLKLSGIIQSRYSIYHKNDTSLSSISNSFDIPNVTVSLQGNLFNDVNSGRNLNYSFGFAFISGAATLQDAFISYFVLPSLDKEKPQLQIVFGQQKKPFGIEAQATEDKAPTVKLAQFVSKISPYANGYGYSGLDLASRDLGFLVKGDLFPRLDYTTNYRVAFIEYAAGIFSGNGPNVSDNNDEKDFLGRLVLNAPVKYSSFFRGLGIGISYQTGKVRQTAFDSTASKAKLILNQTQRERLGFDISYINTPIGFTAEYVRGFDQVFKNSPSKINPPPILDKKAESKTVTVFYNFGQQFVKSYTQQNTSADWWPKTFQPFLRFDAFNPDTGRKAVINAKELTALTAGINIFFAQTTKFQFNYTYVSDGVLKRGDLPKLTDEVLIQFQYGF